MIIIFIKLSGAALILISACRIGLTIKRNISARCILLDSLQAALRYLDGQLSASEEVLSEGMRRCGDSFYRNEKLPDLFTVFADKLDSGEMSVKEAWRDSINSFGGAYILTETDKLALEELGAVLGGADIKRQSEGILNVVNKLSEQSREAKEVEKRDGGIALKLSLAFSAVLVLLLW